MEVSEKRRETRQFKSIQSLIYCVQHFWNCSSESGTKCTGNGFLLRAWLCAF